MSGDDRPGVSPAVSPEGVGHLFRRQAGQMVATLARIVGFEHLELAEDAVQEAFVAALRKWPYHGRPEDPAGWLFRVARNKAVDGLRHRGMARSKEDAIRRSLAGDAAEGSPGPTFTDELRDDQLRMIFACCHPALSRDDQVALTLQVVAGFSAGEIARAFLAAKATVAQRLVRAKRRLRDAGVALEIPPPPALPERLDAALEAIYLLFNEGYETTSGELAIRRDLCHEAIRLVELVAAHGVTSHPRADALAALLCFQAARLPARSGEAGEVLLLPDQDRSRWDGGLVARGLHHLRRSARGEELSSYHLQAEIASCHALAGSWDDTDWNRILSCYDSLLEHDPSPVVAVNRLVALGEVHGPEPALAELEALAASAALERYLPAWVTRAELLRRTGRLDPAREAYARALALEPSEPVRRLVERRRSEIAGAS